MSILESTRKFIADCPYIGKLPNEIHVDFTEPDGDFGVNTSGDVLIKKYTRGTEKRQGNFILYAQNFTTDDVERLENNGFCEDFMFWLSDQNTKKEFPILGDRLTPMSISAENGGLLYYDDTATKGVYQIQIHLTYMREGV